MTGSWELDVLHYRAIDVRGRGMSGEVHAGWVLEGRAVQDVWIMPRCSERSANADKNGILCNSDTLCRALLQTCFPKQERCSPYSLKNSAT